MITVTRGLFFTVDVIELFFTFVWMFYLTLNSFLL